MHDVLTIFGIQGERVTIVKYILCTVYCTCFVIHDCDTIMSDIRDSEFTI